MRCTGRETYLIYSGKEAVNIPVLFPKPAPFKVANCKYSR